MKRTHPTTLIIVGLVGAVVGFLTNSALTALGRAPIVPPATFTIALVVIGAIVFAMAWPIRRAVQGTAPMRMDPFRAARTAVLAKACAVGGALLTGLPLGGLFYLLTRTVIGSGSNLWLTVAAVVGGGLLLTAGLLAEWFCTLPPPDDPDKSEDPGTTPGSTHSRA